jgi:predicted nucleotidyltransferase/predicted DNA-binding protein
VPRTAKVVAFSTTPVMAAEIDRMAASEGRTRSELIREAVRSYSKTVGDCVAQEPAAVYGVRKATSLAGFDVVSEARTRISHVCRKRKVRRLWLFGSAVRDDFNPGQSDFDFLVEWMPDAPKGPWLSHLLNLEEDLAAVLGAPVDVVEAGAKANPYVRESIESERVRVYGPA